MKTRSKSKQRETRHKRIRASVKGTGVRPRLSVYRSNKTIYAQIIDDDKGVTLVAGNDAVELSKKALSKGIKKVTFDRGGFIYTGRIKQFAETARKEGLEF
ncbi:MAG TPA: 50S ribosomal protein L18 [Candidatus Paceibacterota bacterium]